MGMRMERSEVRRAIPRKLYIGQIGTKRVTPATGPSVYQIIETSHTTIPDDLKPKHIRIGLEFVQHCDGSIKINGYHSTCRLFRAIGWRRIRSR